MIIPDAFCDMMCLPAQSEKPESTEKEPTGISAAPWLARIARWRRPAVSPGRCVAIASLICPVLLLSMEYLYVLFQLGLIGHLHKETKAARGAVLAPRPGHQQVSCRRSRTHVYLTVLNWVVGCSMTKLTCGLDEDILTIFSYRLHLKWYRYWYIYIDM